MINTLASGSVTGGIVFPRPKMLRDPSPYRVHSSSWYALLPEFDPRYADKVTMRLLFILIYGGQRLVETLGTRAFQTWTSILSVLCLGWVAHH